jgi:hypothetical protein
MAFVPNTKNIRSDGAQRKMVARGTFSQSDLGAASDDVAVVGLPEGAVITDCHLIVDTLFDGTTPTLTVEVLDLDGADLTAAVVLDTAQSSAAVGRFSSPIVAGIALPEPAVVTVKSNIADSTVGEGAVEVEYYVQGRSDENAD